MDNDQIMRNKAYLLWLKQDLKTDKLFMLNSTEHGIYHAHKLAGQIRYSAEKTFKFQCLSFYEQFKFKTSIAKLTKFLYISHAFAYL